MIKYNNLRISLIRGREPIVNDIEIMDLTLGKRVFGDVALRKAGLFVFVNSSDFTIRWDEKTRIYVTVHDKLKGQMAGLCGNFNDDSNDDLKYKFSLVKKKSYFINILVLPMMCQVVLVKWLNHGKLSRHALLDHHQ